MSGDDHDICWLERWERRKRTGEGRQAREASPVQSHSGDGPPSLDARRREAE